MRKTVQAEKIECTKETMCGDGQKGHLARAQRARERRADRKSGETDGLRRLPGLSRRNVAKELRKNSPSSTIAMKSCGARFGGREKVICPLVTLHYNSGLFFKKGAEIVLLLLSRFSRVRLFVTP